MWYKNVLLSLLMSATCSLYPSVNLNTAQPHTFYTRYANTEGCEIILEPRWVNLEQESFNTKKFGGKWILVGVITFRKTTKNTAHLNNLTLQWLGEKIPCLFGSLYKGYPGKNFLPLEENLICDSLWDMKLQTLKLLFNEKQTLGPVSIFYLVLTVPTPLENALKHGAFKLLPDKLPTPFDELGKKEESLLLEIHCQF